MTSTLAASTSPTAGTARPSGSDAGRAADAGRVAATAQPTSAVRRRYAVVGTGQRAGAYLDAMTAEHADVAEVAALCDTNADRLDVRAEQVRGRTGVPPRRYEAPRLERMLSDIAPDVVVITSPDRHHAHHVTAALDAGADVVVEKPLTIDAAGMYSIADAVRRSNGRLTVTHNYRYAARNAAVRRILDEGRIGDVVSVHFEWLLDTAHGADYFRRWHRDKAASGGLLVHKASHHVDLVNWWIGDVPESVYARGGRHVYQHPDGVGGPEFAIDLTADADLAALYAGPAALDGYRRDRDPFSPGATIEDTLSMLVGYRSGAAMTYALTAHSPWEGHRVAINGTRGRLELDVVERCHARPGLEGLVVPDGGAPACCEVRRRGGRLVVQEQWGVAEEVPLDAEAGHVEGDAAMLHDVLRGHLPADRGGAGDDPLGRRAGLVDGLRAVAVGVAGNRSLATGQVVPTSALGVDLA